MGILLKSEAVPATVRLVPRYRDAYCSYYLPLSRYTRDGKVYNKTQARRPAKSTNITKK